MADAIWRPLGDQTGLAPTPSALTPAAVSVDGFDRADHSWIPRIRRRRSSSREVTRRSPRMGRAALGGKREAAASRRLQRPCRGPRRLLPGPSRRKPAPWHRATRSARRQRVRPSPARERRCRRRRLRIHFRQGRRSGFRAAPRPESPAFRQKLQIAAVNTDEPNPVHPCALGREGQAVSVGRPGRSSECCATRIVSGVRRRCPVPSGRMT